MSGIIMVRHARTPEVKQVPKTEQKSNGKPCTYVVAVDFGTTFSGVAVALLADLDSLGSRREDAVQILDDWPGQAEAGVMRYCKTQTSVWYMPGLEPGTFQLKGWGWEGYARYKACVQDAGSTVNDWNSPLKGYPIIPARVSARSIHRLHQKCGYFVEKFKRGLGDRCTNLPAGLSVERVISDYLREMSKHVLTSLRRRYGKSAGSHRDIQYIFTVPALWTTMLRKAMSDCAEMAGMVQGEKCTDHAAASPYDLKIVSEPEAAARQVHKSLQVTKLQKGEQYLLVDVGGGTTDIVVHEKLGSATRRNFKVKEVSASIGALVGGIDVDKQFYEFLKKTIGCFSLFEERHPRYVLEMNRSWYPRKWVFSSTANESDIIPIQSKLARLWKRSDRDNGRPLRKDYDFLELTPENVKDMFDPVVKRILEIIRRQFVPGLSAMYVVGGFSGCPYLKERIEEAFGNETEVIFLANPGSAVMQGAVLFGATKEWAGKVSSRIASRTIGYDTTVLFQDKTHRQDYMIMDEIEQRRRCDNIFRVVIRKGDDVPDNFVYTQKLWPVHRIGKDADDRAEITLYETQAKNPRYVTDRGVRKLATCFISVPKEKSLGREPEIEFKLTIGHCIRASVEGKNFSGKKGFTRPVWMKWAPLNASLDDSAIDTGVIVHQNRGE